MAKYFGDVEADSEAPKLLLLLSRAGSIRRRRSRSSTNDRVFECKTCNRTFPTFQALGGHRTGHQRQLEDDAAASSPAPAPKKAAHECPVCGLVFPMGQALGGHMRRHKDVLATGNKNNSNNTITGKCAKEEDSAPACSSTGASDLLSGCSSDARHGDSAMEDDLKGGISPLPDFVDLELRLGLAPPTVAAALSEGFLTTLRLGVES